MAILMCLIYLCWFRRPHTLGEIVTVRIDYLKPFMEKTVSARGNSFCDPYGCNKDHYHGCTFKRFNP